ncbi:BMP family ABC transporter substrate-binding protein, partial [Christensenellaceae bacterium OttesenSCG-928-L17]|nr:BMP family ABC transporter substrate-binding protein [Christensenellaceae bacterium OttesenSCG-928-L17]
ALSVFAGCQPSTTPDPSPEQTDPVVEPPATEDPEPAEEGLKIVIVTSTSGVDDGSFNQDNYNGILDFIAENPTATVTAVRETNIDNSVPTVANVMADYDVIVTPGFQFADVYQLAVDNPEKSFILIDSYPTGDAVAENIYAMLFAEEESGFFAGIAAALQTTTGKVAVVNGIAYPSNVNYQFGFESGVNYANAKLGTSVEFVEIASYAGTDVTGANVGGNYIGSFSDEATGKVVGEALLNEGVDILFVAAGMSGNGVFTAVKENGKAFVIGCDVDQYDDGVNGDANIILTSGLKNMRINVYRALNAIQDGTFVGQNVTLRADTDSTGYVSADGRHQLTADTLTKLAEAYELVKSGTVVPAANFNGHASDNFPGLN